MLSQLCGHLEELEVCRKLLYPQDSRTYGPSILSEEHPWVTHGSCFALRSVPLMWQSHGPQTSEPSHYHQTAGFL